MAKKILDEIYIERARALKAAGLIDSIPRKNKINPVLKGQITRLTHEFKQLLKRPEDFAVRKTDDKNLRVLKKSGYKVKNGKAIIPLADGKDHRYEKVKIGKGTLEYSRKGKKNKVYLSGDAKSLMLKAAQLQKGKGRNQVVTFSLRGFAVSSQDYPSFEAMVSYLQNVILPRIVASAELGGEDEEEATEKFWSSVSIVTIGDKIAKRKK